MDFALVEQSIKAAYRDVCHKYRQDDELEVTTENHRRLADILRGISSSFRRPLSVLDAGCGTGRYFHCLENVDLLVGIDLCPEMLEAAREPVRHQSVTASNIRLICENIHQVSLPRQTFDFIYSLGMFGNGCPVTVELCNHFHEWLVPGGKLFFNIVNHIRMPLGARIKKDARRLIYKGLPRSLKNFLDERERRLPFFPLARRELEDILGGSRFREFKIVKRACDSPLWQGTHLECTTSKSA
jgi:SAM-dependent methyltransferase